MRAVIVIALLAPAWLPVAAYVAVRDWRKVVGW